MAKSEFGSAFAAARKAGDKTFEFNGKKYTTETADESGSAKKAARDSDMRKQSDMISALKSAERNAPEETSAMARQKMASGGSVSAFRRADGIAQRGKTRGKIC